RRLLRRALELRVDRELERVAGDRLRLRNDDALLTSERVDGQLRRPVLAAEVRVVRGLDARLPDLVGRLVALLLQRRVLLRVDRTDVAQHLRRERLVRVLPERRLLEPGARELRLVLLEIEVLVLLEAALDDNRCDRVVLALLELREHRRDADARNLRERAK